MVYTSGELQLLIDNRPAKSKMVEVEESAIEVAKALINTSECRTITADELVDLAKYLSVNTKELKGPFILKSSLKCSFCARNISFLDFVKSAPETHSKHMITQVMCGKKGYWVTVQGKDDFLDVKCIECGHNTCFFKSNYRCRQYAFV